MLAELLLTERPETVTERRPRWRAERFSIVPRIAGLGPTDLARRDTKQAGVGGRILNIHVSPSAIPIQIISGPSGETSYNTTCSSDRVRGWPHLDLHSPKQRCSNSRPCWLMAMYGIEEKFAHHCFSDALEGGSFCCLFNRGCSSTLTSKFFKKQRIPPSTFFRVRWERHSRRKPRALIQKGYAVL